jgi:hypothetical protein
MRFLIISSGRSIRGRVHSYLPTNVRFYLKPSTEIQLSQDTDQQLSQNSLDTRFFTQRKTLQSGLRVSQQKIPIFKFPEERLFQEEPCIQLRLKAQYETMPSASAPTEPSQHPCHEQPGVELPIDDISTSLRMHQDNEASGIIMPQSFNRALEEFESHNKLCQSRLQTSVTTKRKHPKRRRAKEKEAKEKIPPSIASGGIPKPHPFYLFRSTVESRPEEPPLPKLLVIDLNGTLLFRRRSKGSFKVRPSAKIFLNFVLENFKVMIWSSAEPSNVQRMCEGLLPQGARQELLAEWSRQHLDLDAEDYWRRVQVYKRLWKVWDDPDIQAKHPFHGQDRRWGQHNTILVDDEMEKAKSEPYNLVHIPEYEGQKDDEDTLKHVAQYLYRLRGQSNVSAYIREHPFKMPE